MLKYQSMKKLFTLERTPYIILIFIAILAIIFGSFFDLQLSQSVVNINDGFGHFLETVGLIPAFIIMSFIGTLIFKGLKDNKHIALKIVGWLALVICFAASTYFTADILKQADPSLTIYVNYPMSWLVGVLVSAAYLAFSLYFIKSDDKMGMLRLGLMLLVCSLLVFGLYSLLKIFAGRPRYRAVINPEVATEFRNWWEFKRYTGDAQFKDYFKSWPSGHSAICTWALGCALVTPFFRKKGNHTQLILEIIAVIYILLIIASRIRVGAHYLSDTGFGLLIGSSMFLAGKEIFDHIKFFKPKSENIEELQA